MSKVRNISGGPLDVPLLGRSVEDGEIVDVPDFQPAHTAEDPAPIVWPSNRWEPVTDGKAAYGTDHQQERARRLAQGAAE